MTSKKNCHKCCGLIYNKIQDDYACYLGHSIDQTNRRPKPMEDCRKPMSFDRLVILSRDGKHIRRIHQEGDTHVSLDDDIIVAAKPVKARGTF